MTVRGDLKTHPATCKSNNLFWSLQEPLEGSCHFRANYEKHTQATNFMFGPMGLFEEAKALKADVQKGKNMGYEHSIMMTVFHKALVSCPLTGLQGLQREYLPEFFRKLGTPLPLNNH